MKIETQLTNNSAHRNTEMDLGIILFALTGLSMGWTFASEKNEGLSEKITKSIIGLIIGVIIGFIIFVDFGSSVPSDFENCRTFGRFAQSC